MAVIGPLADSKEATEGSWMVFGHTPAAVTVLEGIRARLPEAHVAVCPRPRDPAGYPVMVRKHDPRQRKRPTRRQKRQKLPSRSAVEVARGAEMVIMVLGENADMAGEAASRALR